MALVSRLIVAGSLLAAVAGPATAEPLPVETTGTAQVEQDAEVVPPGAILAAPQARTRVADVARVRHDPLATTERWGGGIRLTGLSGIGALPGVNYGAEVAGLVRHDEYFVELALSRWKPEHAYVVTETPDHVELGLDAWTLRGGWASMTKPLRAWALAEVGEVAGPSGMQGVVTRMVMGDTPQNRQWRAVGAGVGVAWPVSNQARLVGTMEIAVPLNRDHLMLDQYGTYAPDPLAARYSVGLEVGWR